MNSKRFLSLALSTCLGLLFLPCHPATASKPQIRKLRWATPRNVEAEHPSSANQCPEGGDNEWFAQQRIVFLTGEINSELAEAIVTQLLRLDAKAPGQDIYMYINSPGGEISSGLAIYDVMKSLRSPVVTVSMGEASSMASFLLAAGTKGKRLALPNARIMIHQPIGGWIGQASDIAIEAKELGYIKSKLNQMLAAMTGQPLSRIQADTDRDFYMSAQEAKAYGLVDNVVQSLPAGKNSKGE